MWNRLASGQIARLLPVVVIATLVLLSLVLQGCAGNVDLADEDDSIGPLPEAVIDQWDDRSVAPAFVAVDGSGRVFVCAQDGGATRYETDGTSASFSVAPSGGEDVRNFNCSSGGELYVTYVSDSTGLSTTDVYSPTGGANLGTLGTGNMAPEQVSWFVCVDPEDHVYALYGSAEWGLGAGELTDDGSTADRWFGIPTSVIEGDAVDATILWPRSNILIVDRGGEQLVEFKGDDTHREYPALDANGERYMPIAAAGAHRDNVFYVVGQTNRKVVEYDQDFNAVSERTFDENLTDVAVDSGGNVYVLGDSTLRRFPTDESTE